jgi:hypothetical protein
MATVLIIQCLQRDFVDPISPHDPLPNLLHVGYSEAARLQGASETDRLPATVSHAEPTFSLLKCPASATRRHSAMPGK